MPIVIRLTGTNEEEAIRILKEVGMPALSDMDEAVQQVVALATGGRMSIFVDDEHPAAGPGHHRPRGLVPRPADARVRHRRSSPA